VSPSTPESKRKHVILSLSYPARVTDTVGLISAVFSFVDSLSQINLRPETKSKLKKVREELDKNLRAEAEKEKKEEVCLIADSRNRRANGVTTAFTSG
jgi:hypothetical protein